MPCVVHATGVPLVSKRNPGVVVDKLGHAALELSETAPGFQWHTDKGEDFWRDSAPARSDFVSPSCGGCHIWPPPQIVPTKRSWPSAWSRAPPKLTNPAASVPTTLWPHPGAPSFSEEMRNSIHPIWSERLGGYLGVAHRHLSTGWQKEGAPFMCTPLRCHSRSHAMQQPELDLTPRPSAVR